MKGQGQTTFYILTREISEWKKKQLIKYFLLQKGTEKIPKRLARITNLGVKTNLKIIKTVSENDEYPFSLFVPFHNCSKIVFLFFFFYLNCFYTRNLNLKIFFSRWGHLQRDYFQIWFFKRETRTTWCEHTILFTPNDQRKQTNKQTKKTNITTCFSKTTNTTNIYISRRS